MTTEEAAPREEAASRGRYRDALRQRDFGLLMGGFVIDQVGSWAYSVVLAVYVFDRTHSTVWLATMSTSRWLVGLLFAGIGGLISDKYERTHVMRTVAILSGLVMTVIAFAVGQNWPIWSLLALGVIAAIIASPYRPAAGALTPEIVSEKDLAAANSLFAMLENLVVVLGPAIGGLLLVLGSPVAGVIINAASFFVAAGIITLLRVRSHGKVEPGTGLIAQWSAGFKAIGQHRTALILVLFCALDSSVYGASTVIYAPLSEHLGTGVNGYSYLLAGQALGCVLAAGLANRLSARSRLAPVIAGSIAVQALPFALTALVSTPALAFVLQMVSGVGMVIVDILAITALQRNLDGGVLSRVLGAFDAIVISTIMAGSFIMAAVFSQTDLKTALVALGFGVPVVALIGLPFVIKSDRKSAEEAARIGPRVDVLGKLDLFTGATRPVLERLAKSAEERDVPAGEQLIREGDPADALWILLDGSLSVTQGGDGASMRELPVVSAPNYVGELGLVRNVPRTASVSTREDSKLLRIEGTEFLDALESAPPSASFVQLTGDRWSRTNRSSSS
jgi:MFS family permease